MGVKSGSSLFTAAYFFGVTIYFKTFWKLCYLPRSNKLTNSLRKQQLELLTRTWLGRAPLRVLGKQNSLFPLGPVIKCLLPLRSQGRSVKKGVTYTGSMLISWLNSKLLLSVILTPVVAAARWVSNIKMSSFSACAIFGILQNIRVFLVIQSIEVNPRLNNAKRVSKNSS